ncbi:MAG TPA: hypothetical protein VFZ75_04805 [Actinomycetota bacterium]|nr:hypothetical protein [Actinomycetota bacterium]
MTRAMGRAWAWSVSAVLIALGSVLLPARVASACSCAGPDVPASLADADGAFVGRWVSREVIGDGRAAVTFDVERVVKGRFGPTAIVRTHEQASACGLELLGSPRTGLLLQRPSDGVWESDLCSMIPASELLAVDAGQPPNPGVAPVSAGWSTAAKATGLGLVIVLTGLIAGGFWLRHGRRPPEGSEVA